MPDTDPLLCAKLTSSLSDEIISLNVAVESVATAAGA